MGPANQIASATTPPTARPEEGCRLILPAPGAAFRKPITPRITNIRKKVRITSIATDGAAGMAGTCAPIRPRCSGSSSHSAKLASTAPTTWLAT